MAEFASNNNCYNYVNRKQFYPKRDNYRDKFYKMEIILKYFLSAVQIENVFTTEGVIEIFAFYIRTGIYKHFIYRDNATDFVSNDKKTDICFAYKTTCLY